MSLAEAKLDIQSFHGGQERRLSVDGGSDGWRRERGAHPLPRACLSDTDRLVAATRDTFAIPLFRVSFGSIKDDENSEEDEK